MDQASGLRPQPHVVAHDQRPLLRNTAAAAGRARLRLALWPALILLALLVADLAAFRFHPNPMYHLDVGSWGDEALVDGMFAQETDVLSVNYRWTSARSSFHVHGFVSVPRPLLEFTVGGLPSGAKLPRPITLQTTSGPLLTVPIAAQRRHYQFVLPESVPAHGNVDLTFTGPTSTITPDPRQLGIRLDDIALGWTSGQWVMPTALILVVQWAGVLVWLGIAWRLELSRRWWPLLVIGLVVSLPVMTAARLLVATPWQTRLLVTSLILLALAWHALPLLARLCPALDSQHERTLLCLLTVAVVTVQLFPVFYPLFGSHDLYIHLRRLQDVQLGSLKLFDTPSEFAGRKTIVPSAFYVLVSPFTLLTSTPGPAIQGVYAFLQGTNPLLVAIFVRQIGGSRRAALIAALAIAWLPIQVTILWWGFGPQIVGQWLLLLLAVFMTRANQTRWSFWFVAGAALWLAFLMHDGVALLGGVWLGLYVLLLWWFGRGSSKLWLRWSILLVVCTLIATALLYSDVVALQMSSLAAGVRASNITDQPMRLRFLVDGLWTSSRPLGVLFALACCTALLLHTRAHHRYLATAWLLSTLIFLLIDVRFALQVRYMYFAIPIVCAGLGLLLDRLMLRRPWGWLAGWGMLAAISYSGIVLLYGSILWGFKPLLSALTH